MLRDSRVHIRVYRPDGFLQCLPADGSAVPLRYLLNIHRSVVRERCGIQMRFLGYHYNGSHACHLQRDLCGCFLRGTLCYRILPFCAMTSATRVPDWFPRRRLFARRPPAGNGGSIRLSTADDLECLRRAAGVMF